MSDWQGDPNLHALDRETGELIVSFGRIGPGPGEFAGMLVGMQMLPRDTSAVWVFDARRLTRVERPGPIASDVAVVEPTATPTLLRAAWLDSVTIVGVNLRPPEKRFMLFDAAGNVTRTVPGVLLGHDGIPMPRRVDASLNSHPGIQCRRGFGLVVRRLPGGCRHLSVSAAWRRMGVM